MIIDNYEIQVSKCQTATNPWPAWASKVLTINQLIIPRSFPLSGIYPVLDHSRRNLVKWISSLFWVINYHTFTIFLALDASAERRAVLTHLNWFTAKLIVYILHMQFKNWRGEKRTDKEQRMSNDGEALNNPSLLWESLQVRPVRELTSQARELTCRPVTDEPTCPHTFPNTLIKPRQSRLRE